MKTKAVLIAGILTCSSLSLIAQENTEPSGKKEKVRAEKPYIIHDRSNKVSRVEVRKDLKATDNIIQIDATNASGGANLASSSSSLAAAIISNVNVISGNYNQIRQMSKSARGMTLQLLDVVYPCRVRINIADQYADVEFKEPGFWKISLGLIN